MPNTIMIFGAGINQMALILAAKELGLTTIVVDPAENPPGKDLADHYYQVGKEDYASTKAIAIKHNVAGIVTSQMENPLKIMAQLSLDLGLIFHSPEIVENSTNKYLMKRAFIAAGVPCAWGMLVRDYKVLDEKELKRHKLPLIIKPLQSFSSRGVYKINNYMEYRDKVDITLSHSRDGAYLLEEFIDGPEFSVESITYRGNTTVVQYTDKIIAPYPSTVEIGHVQPAGLTDAQKSDVDKAVCKALKALKIDNSAAHTELKLSHRGPVIIEIGPRLGGDFISSHLCRLSTGICMDKAAIQVALGMDPIMERTKNTGSAIMYLVLPERCKIDKIMACDTLMDLPGVYQYNLDLAEGSIISPLTDSAKRSGWVITYADSHDLAYKRAQKALDYMKSRLSLIRVTEVN